MKPIILIIDNRCVFAFKKQNKTKTDTCYFCLTTKQVNYVVEDKNICSRCLIKKYCENKQYITDIK